MGLRLSARGQAPSEQGLNGAFRPVQGKTRIALWCSGRTLWLEVCFLDRLPLLIAAVSYVTSHPRVWVGEPSQVEALASRVRAPLRVPCHLADRLQRLITLGCHSSRVGRAPAPGGPLERSAPGAIRPPRDPRSDRRCRSVVLEPRRSRLGRGSCAGSAQRRSRRRRAASSRAAVTWALTASSPSSKAPRASSE